MSALPCSRQVIVRNWLTLINEARPYLYMNLAIYFQRDSPN